MSRARNLHDVIDYDEVMEMDDKRHRAMPDTIPQDKTIVKVLDARYPEVIPYALEALWNVAPLPNKTLNTVKDVSSPVSQYASDGIEGVLLPNTVHMRKTRPHFTDEGNERRDKQGKILDLLNFVVPIGVGTLNPALGLESWFIMNGIEGAGRVYDDYMIKKEKADNKPSRR